jgi:arylsulfatase A-like enzyme
MNFKIKILLVSLAAIFVASPVFLESAEGQNSPAKPNIVLIFIDDMGYGDIGPFGSKLNRTPQLDRMAREGMKLTSFYAAPVCSVSRAQVITGCYGVRVSIPGVFGPGTKSGLNAAEHTVAELMKAQSYATMAIGKWHLGDQPAFLPTRHGFDKYFGIPYSNDMNRKSSQDGRSVVPLVRDEQVIELLDGAAQDNLTERYTDEAVKFIRENRERPFFLYLPHTAVHTPIHPGEKFRDKSVNGRFGDWVEEVDWSVGRVLDTLRELKLDSNTLVIFTSDNGPWLAKGKDAGTAGPLRGGKGSTWEGGVREPTLAWWPGRIAPGSVSDAIAGNIDFLPTFVSLAGGTVPTDRKIDGKDITPLLLGKTKESPHEAHYYYDGYQLHAVRSGPWKLAVAPQNEGMGMAGPSVPATFDQPRLYNLDNEIGEQTDVAAAHPDVVKRLQALAEKMAAELGDGKPGPAVRPAGSVDNPVMLYPSDEPGRKGEAEKTAKINANATKSGSAIPSASLNALKLGDTLSPDAAPQIAGQPFTISGELEPKSENGVIVAHGGSVVGYALYLKDGRVVFTVHAGKDATSITAGEAPAGRFAVEARLAAGGAMTLALNGKSVATGKAGSLIPRQPQENFCVGHDDAKPVTDYGGKPEFQGTLEHLKITVDAKQ